MKKDFVSLYDNQVLPISFINNFISEYIEKNNLNTSLNKIKYVNNNEIGVGCAAGYDVNSKILLIDYEQIIKICIELYGMDSKIFLYQQLIYLYLILYIMSLFI
ncbi:MAG: hypothetical protein MR411_04325 [Tenericutes bacterium]|nr:hypothetical protein [Mycoplasmatota bacterium]